MQNIPMGKGFVNKLGGEVKYYDSVFLIYYAIYQKCRHKIFNSS